MRRSSRAACYNNGVDTIASQIANIVHTPGFALYAVLAIGLVVYFLLLAPDRKTQHVVDLLRELDVITQKLSEAERIGSFGSFAWDFADPSASFWSEEMYTLTGLVKRRKPPAIDVFAEIAHEEDRASVKRQWELAQEQPGDFGFVFRALAPSGQVRYLRVQGKTTFNVHKQALVQGVAHDITKEMGVDRAKSEFVSLASHQLKTPITSIRWIAEALEKEGAGSFTPEQMQYVSTIRQESERMIGMVNDFLNVSRLELGTLAVQIEDFDVCELARGVIMEQQHAADAGHLTLTLICASSLPHLSADKNLVRMILQNLVSNAIKYTMPQGKVECEISTSGVLRESVAIRVSDTGIGIPKEEQDRVFEKLHRASNARSALADGTGLGLYLVKTIVDLAGGSISFESTAGKGTTFHVSLPLFWESREGKVVQ